MNQIHEQWDRWTILVTCSSLYLRRFLFKKSMSMVSEIW